MQQRPALKQPRRTLLRVWLQRHVRIVAAVCLLLSVVFVVVSTPRVSYAAIFVAAPTALIASQQAENAMVRHGVLLTGPSFFALATCRSAVRLATDGSAASLVRMLGSGVVLAYALKQNIPLWGQQDERTIWQSCRRISGFWGLLVLPVTNGILYAACGTPSGATMYLPGETSLSRALVVNAFVVAIFLAINEENRERLHRLWLVPLSALTANYLRPLQEPDPERNVDKVLGSAVHWQRADRSAQGSEAAGGSSCSKRS